MTMGVLIKLIDAMLFVFFLVIAFAVPLLDAQTILPSNIFPNILIHFKNWFTLEFGNYLLSEKPHFFVGIAWMELLFAWPLSIISLYGIVSGKSWLPITCFTFGLYFLTALVFLTSPFNFFFSTLYIKKGKILHLKLDYFFAGNLVLLGILSFFSCFFVLNKAKDYPELL